jgi:hypothetical protein
MKNNKANKKDRNEKMIAGIKQQFGNLPTVIVDGVPMAPAVIEKTLQDPIDLAVATVAAEGVFHKAVADEHTATLKADALFVALKTFVFNQVGNDAKVLALFGLSPRKRRGPRVAVKAAAADKARATRTARGTRGAQQKKGIKGNPPAAPAKPA